MNDTRTELDYVELATQMEHLIATRPQQLPTETRSTFGARVLLFILATDITGPFTAIELECALAASIHANCNPDMLAPSRVQIANVRHRITSLLDARRRELARATRVPFTAPEGRMDGTMPIRPIDAPKPNPPLDSLQEARERLRDAF